MWFLIMHLGVHCGLPHSTVSLRKARTSFTAKSPVDRIAPGMRFVLNKSWLRTCTLTAIWQHVVKLSTWMAHHRVFSPRKIPTRVCKRTYVGMFFMEGESY